MAGFRKLGTWEVQFSYSVNRTTANYFIKNKWLKEKILRKCQSQAISVECEWCHRHITEHCCDIFCS